jgi:hypothetical protein
LDSCKSNPEDVFAELVDPLSVVDKELVNRMTELGMQSREVVTVGCVEGEEVVDPGDGFISLGIGERVVGVCLVAVMGLNLSSNVVQVSIGCEV